MALMQLFDTYSLRARLQPALLVLLPPIVTILAWFPAVYEAAVALVGVVATCGLTTLLAQIARQQGRKVEDQVFSSWGGKPTTISLRHRDRHLDTGTKVRYHAFLEQHVPQWQAPTVEEEEEQSAESDARYDSAISWLQEYTRDKIRFPIVFQENVGYGFRRNLYGLKCFGIALAIMAVVLNAALLYVQPDLVIASGVAAVGIAALAFNILAVFIWLAVVNPAWVRDAADAYARSLLACCDEPPAREL